MLKGLDFSFGSGLTAAQIKAAGYSFVGRYLSGGGSKDDSAAELANYKAAGLGVIHFWETDGSMPNGPSGAVAAHAAQAELDAMAAILRDQSLSFAPVFFAADAAAVADEPDYLAATASVIGKARNGVYGGLATVKAAFDRGLVTYAVQTYAWSGGAWDDRALVRQWQNGVTFGPAQVDLESAAFWASSTKVLGPGDDYGQWPPPGAAPAPAPPPAAGPYWHMVPAGNASTIEGLARGRGTTVAAITALSQAHLDSKNLPVLNAYLALDEALVLAGRPRPAMPEGLVYLTVNP